MGIRVDDIPRIRGIADSPHDTKIAEIPWVVNQNISRNTLLHVDVFRHRMGEV